MFRDFRSFEGGGGELRLPRLENDRRLVLIEALGSCGEPPPLGIGLRGADGSNQGEFLVERPSPRLPGESERILAEPHADREPFDSFRVLVKIFEMIEREGGQLTTSSAEPYFDMAARFIKREIDALDPLTMARVIGERAIAPGIIHLSFPDQITLAETMLRFQEYYESPRFHGTVFTRYEFAAWYRTAQPHGEFSYHFDWPGFNVPVGFLIPFESGAFGTLTPGEGAVLEKTAPFPKKRSS